MKSENLKALILSLTQDIVFEYDGGVACINPWNETRIEAGYDDKVKIYDNIDNYIITGYAFDRTKDTKIPNICLVLLDETTGIYYGIYTEIQKREDVTKEYGNEKYNYDLSGFVGYFSKKMIQKDHKYKICLIYKSDENKNFIASELYIEE